MITRHHGGARAILLILFVAIALAPGIGGAKRKGGRKCEEAGSADDLMSVPF